MKKPSLAIEAVAGVTTFFTMAYIVVVNPAILSTPGTGMPFDGVLTATVLLTIIATLMMGIYAKLPFAVAPGMGINAFFTFNVILGRKVPWQTALGIVFWAGVLFILVSATPIRTAIARAIPRNLRNATAAGIGIFLSFIGLKNAGFITSDPATFVKLGTLGVENALSLVGLLITVFFMNRKNPLAILLGIFVVTMSASALGLLKAPSQFFSKPDFTSVFFQLDIWGALKLSLLPTLISILFTDLFDSISTFIGVSSEAGLLDEKGDPKNLKEGLLVDAFATMGAGLLGTSSGTAYIESSAGIEAGGRTGWTAIFTAICFLPCFFVGPLVAAVPMYATAPVLILVGSFMFRNVVELNLKKFEDSIPAFLTVILIPLTFSITQGLLWGFVSHATLYTLAGRGKEVTKTMYALATLSAFLLVVEHSSLRSLGLNFF